MSKKQKNGTSARTPEPVEVEEVEETEEEVEEELEETDDDDGSGDIAGTAATGTTPTTVVAPAKPVDMKAVTALFAEYDREDEKYKKAQVTAAEAMERRSAIVKKISIHLGNQEFVHKGVDTTITARKFKKTGKETYYFRKPKQKEPKEKLNFS